MHPIKLQPQHAIARPSNQTGFTLLELLFASTVFLVGFTMLASTLITLSHTRAAAEYKTIAASIANSVLDELSRTKGADLLAYVPPSFPAVNVPYEIEIRYGVTPQGPWVSPPLAPGAVTLSSPARIEVQVDVSVTGARPVSYITTTLVRP